MTHFIRAALKILVMLGSVGILLACTSKSIPGVADANCTTGPIDNAAEAERRAVCYFRSIPDVCPASTLFRNQVVGKEDTWEIRRVASISSCKSWLAILSSKDGHLVKMTPAQ